MEFIKQSDDYVFPGEKNGIDQRVKDLLFAANPGLGEVEKLTTDVYISDDNIIWLAKYRVMYGYRLKAGFVSSMLTDQELDICCGDNPDVFNVMFKSIKEIVNYNVSRNLSPFHNIPPFSKIKPYINDTEFVDKILQLLKKAKGV